MGQGYVASSGLEGLQQAIRQRVADEMVQRQREQEMALAERRMKLSEAEMGMRHAEWGQQREDRQMNLDRQKQQDEQANKNRELTQAEKLNESITPGTTFKKDSPIAGQLRMVGGVQQEDAHLPSTQFNGGAAIPADGGVIRGTLRMANLPGNDEQYRKVETAGQANTRTDNERQALALKQTGENQDWRNSISQELATLKGATPPHQPTPHFTAQDRFDETGKPQSGNLNTLTGEWKPTLGQGSVHAAPGAAAAVGETRHKKEAVDTLNQLDQAIDAASDFIGPGAGRVSSLEQMAGSADPRVQALGTKMLLAKMKVDAGIGGMRAAASPGILARWDNILSQNVTKEGLKSAVQAMREILSSGATSTGAGKIKSITEIKP